MLISATIVLVDLAVLLSVIKLKATLEDKISLNFQREGPT